MRALMIRLVVLLAGLVATGASAQENDLHEEIVQAFTAINIAFEHDDTETIRAMTTADHVSIASFYGGAISLDEQLDVDEHLEIMQHPVGAITVEGLAPDIALQNHTAERTGTFRGQPVPPLVAVTILWQRVDGDWRERLYQETAIDD